jgi:hypothetical protein
VREKRERERERETLFIIHGLFASPPISSYLHEKAFRGTRIERLGYKTNRCSAIFYASQKCIVSELERKRNEQN